MKKHKESEVLGLISKLQEQVVSLDKKMDILMGRVMATPVMMSQSQKAANNAQQHKEKVVYNIICADCGKEATLPFKPSGDRPVYCKDCFTLRRHGSGPIRAEESNPNMAPSLVKIAKKEDKAPQARVKKRQAPAKKTSARKKSAAKKKG